MMSQALDNRLPPPESRAPWNTFRDEDWVEDGKGEHGTVIRHQAPRATPYTRPNQGDVPATARRAESPPTDITDSYTDGSDVDVEESTVPLHKILKPAFGKIEAKPKEVPKPEHESNSGRQGSLPPESGLGQPEHLD
jgi:hypothetical protein